MFHNVAIVDDEVEILESMKWVFMNEPYDILTFQNPLNALEQLEHDECAVVVSDLMMPDMDGAILLKKVKRRWPEVECIIMTGSKNRTNLEVDCPVIYKPWSIDAFRTLIKKAIAKYESRKEHQRKPAVSEFMSQKLDIITLHGI